MSEVKVNKISPRSGTTVTIGDSGDTINLVGTLQNNGSPLAGDISSVVAGTGLSGGATSGVATLNIEAAQPTITSLGTITSFTSTGIDDNATSTAITIDSSERVGIGETDNSTYVLGKKLVIGELENNDGITLKSSTTTHTNYLAFADADGGLSSYRGFFGYNHTDNSFRLGTDSSERMRIDSSGNVGIGTTSTSSANLVIATNSNGGSGMRLIGKSANGGAEIDYYNNANSTFNGFLEISDTQGTLAAVTNIPFTFRTNNTERMRIDSSGRVLIGTTSAGRFDRETLEVKNTTGEAILAQTNGLSYAGFNYKSLQSTGGTHYIAWFENSSGTNVGEITHNNSSTSYVTTSDYRLKENVSYDFDATTRLKQLKPARFNFISNADTTVDGFLAHEVSSIVPEAISGEKDAVDEDGNPQYQGIDQSKLVPLLVKTIQELEARITQLENA